MSISDAEVLNSYGAMTTKPIILIADRNEDVSNCIKQELAAAGFALLHAKDGKEALSIVESHAPHIAAAVIELELPVVNGLDVIGRLSQQPKPKKIIATTFHEYEPLLELAKHMGADAVVRKPVPNEIWIETVRQLAPECTGNEQNAP